MSGPSFPVLSALAQPSRWRAFELLLDAGEKGMLQGEIATALGVTKNLLSAHLKTMQTAGLVSAERSGREVTYRATPGPARAMAQAILDTVERSRRRS